MQEIYKERNAQVSSAVLVLQEFRRAVELVLLFVQNNSAT
jgi:hypothetical protein